MRILKIGGRNLASLAGDFSVDFEREPLASAGLFAISGPTGAGKSTLLDALCLALYEATPRLLKVAGRSMLADVGAETVSTQDPRTLLRRGAAEGYAEVDFIGNDGAAYRARWSVRRSRTKAEGALQPTQMSLHRLPALQPLGGTKTEVKAEIEKRIGLSFEQFTRAVLLAQNEFSAFLKSEDNERGELLETLTGSTVYSDISMRAFERNKLEQAALQRLNARLADQKPLGAEERAAIETRHAAAAEALHGLERRQDALEQELRWHRQAEKLREEEQLAHQAGLAAAARVEQAAPRRQALARVLAVQPARPLAEEPRRIAADTARTQAALDAGAQLLAGAVQALEQAGAAQAQASVRLEEAERARRAAAPGLDQAKALDASIAAITPAHRQAVDASAQADRADSDAGAALQAKRGEADKLAAQQEADAAWLAHNARWKALAQSWERWDVLFTQAGQAAAQADKLAQSLARVLRGAKTHREQEADAGARLARSAAALAALEARRQDTARALSAFDPERLRAARRGHEQRRDLLAGAEKIWLELEARQARGAQIEAQSAQLRLAMAAAETALAAARQDGVAVMAAFAQAERSLKLAEAACGENVESLRAALEDDTPCPVCGAHEHPYRHHDGALQAMLGGLQAELARCRAQLKANMELEAGQHAKVQASVEQLNLLAGERRALAQALERATRAWHAHPLLADGGTGAAAAGHDAGGAGTKRDSAEAPADGDEALADALPALPPEAERSAWFVARLDAAGTALRALESSERALQQARAARDQAQSACELAAAEHARLRETAASARTALAQSETEHQALEDQRIEIALTLSGLLSDLDPAFSGGDLPSEDWKDDWNSGPARFHEARRAESRQWLAHSAARDERAAALAGMDIELKALAAAAARTGQEALAARNARATVAASLQDMRRQRMALWDGAPVADIERALQAAIDTAAAALAERQAATQQAAHRQARQEQALEQDGQRLAALRSAAAAAAAALAAWVDAFRRDQPDAGLDGLEHLHALLAQPAADIDAERAALHAIDRGADQAATVLAERRRQREQHRLSAPPAGTLAEPAGPSAAADGLAPDGRADGGTAASGAGRPAGRAEDAEDAEDAGEAAGAGANAIAALSTALNALLAERKQAQDDASALGLALAQDDARRRQGQAMLAEIAAQEAVAGRWARMDNLIGSADGKRFRNYAQQFTLDVLLGYANAHLRHLARRYRLERIQNPANPSLALLVRDQDMGGETRSVHSLSGGESFLVSLALALGLASLSSNRVRVESLFIDEGFGSLDAETLRVAMDALDGLQAMGRKVGVISHVQEMTERISTRILVQPSAGGKSAITVR